MAEEKAPSPSEASKDALDLNALSGLNFGPNWADEKSSDSSKHKNLEERGTRKGKGKRSNLPPTRDRRSGGRPPRARNDYGKERDGHGKRDNGRGHTPSEFVPTVKVDLYPQDEAFDALVKRLRSSARTYQLFEIAHLLLEKPERYVVVVAPKPKSRDTGGSEPLLYYSVPGHLPFESEEQAINYVLKEHIDLFFDVEEIEVEPPSGNFLMVNRCGITGELLGPPNYHRYQEFVQRHYAARISGMSLERFQSKIVGSKEQEDIDKWLEGMKKGARYTVKDREENEPESFETLESARHFLITHRKDKVVGSGESIRFAGRDLERIPGSNIRRSVEAYVEQQKHFPLDTANNIRGRLRRHKFAVYKKGSKGVSYVCAVKRKFRESHTVFTDSISDLIDFIENHPNMPASKLSSEYIGIDTERQKPEALKMKEPSEYIPTNTTETEAAPAKESEQVEEAESDSQAGSDTVEVAAAAATPVAAEVEASTVAAVETSTQAKPKSPLSKEEQEQLNQLMLDLRWLITEGYVTEYGDGSLFTPPPLSEPKKKLEPSPTVKSKDAEKKPENVDKEAASAPPVPNTGKTSEAASPEAKETTDTSETEDKSSEVADSK